MGLFEILTDTFPFLLDPVFTYVSIGIVIVIGYFFLIRKGDLKTKMKLWYFADVERLVSPLDVKQLTPNRVITTDDKGFLRRAKSWLYRDNNKSFVMWLGKVGKGITYRLERNNKDTAGNPIVEKIGSLYDGLKLCLNIKEADELTPQTFTPETLELLKQSEIFVCVDLETDTDEMPKITEEIAIKDSDRNFADLVGLKIKAHLRKEDWIRNGGLMAMGALGYHLAIQLGLI